MPKCSQRILRVVLVIAGCTLLLTAANAVGGSYVKVPAYGDGGADPLLNFTIIDGYNTKGYLMVVSNPISHLHIGYPKAADGTCKGYVMTSKGAAAEGCIYATNAGPFIMNQPAGRPTCLGYVISDGFIAYNKSNTNANFGLTKDGYFVLGQLTPSDLDELAFDQLVSGFGWLVRDGRSTTKPGGLIAPRTAVGVDTEGRLLLFEVDGYEYGSPPVGLTLDQLAHWFASLGAHHAVNLDGGGSSVIYYKGAVVDTPTCVDTPVKCERDVTTFVCVK